MNIYGLTLEELENYFIDVGSKKFHADQLFSWLYEKRIKSYDEATNIKKELLEKVSHDYSIDHLKLVSVERDVDVCKYLLIVFVFLLKLVAIWDVGFVNLEEEKRYVI